MWVSNHRVKGTRLRHIVRGLDRQPPVYEHLLHHLVEEVFSLRIRPGLEDGLEVVDEGEDMGAVELRSFRLFMLPCTNFTMAT